MDGSFQSNLGNIRSLVVQGLKKDYLSKKTAQHF